MNSDLLTRWTAIITNIAIVIGLVFVGLEFRNNSRSIEAERIDSFIGGNAEINSLIVENENLAELIFRAHTVPDSLTSSELDRVQSWMLMNYDSFQRQMLANQAGLLSDKLFEQQKAGIGFIFSSNVGMELIDLFRASALDSEVWEAISASTKSARKYCLNPANICMARYEAIRESGG